jgi:micrococcal nuclease
MRKTLTALAAGSLLVIPISSFAESFRALVVAVPAANVLKLTRVDAGTTEMIRIYGIESPRSGQPFSKEAKDFTESLAGDQIVIVDIVERSRRGATANITLSDGTRLGASILKNGWGWRYNVQAPDDDFYQALERQARVRRIGLWQDRNPVPPWEWRPYHRYHHPRPPDARVNEE